MNAVGYRMRCSGNAAVSTVVILSHSQCSYPGLLETAQIAGVLFDMDSFLGLASSSLLVTVYAQFKDKL